MKLMVEVMKLMKKNKIPPQPVTVDLVFRYSDFKFIITLFFCFALLKILNGGLSKKNSVRYAL